MGGELDVISFEGGLGFVRSLHSAMKENDGREPTPTHFATWIELIFRRVTTACTI